MLSDSKEYEMPWTLLAAMALLHKETRCLEASSQFAGWYLDLAIKGVEIRDIVMPDPQEPSHGSRRQKFYLGWECSRHAYSLPIDHLHRAVGLSGGEWASYLIAGFTASIIDRSLAVGWGPFDLTDFEWLMTNPIPTIKVSDHLTDKHSWFISTSANSIAAAPSTFVRTHYSAGGLFNKIWGTSGV